MKTLFLLFIILVSTSLMISNLFINHFSQWKEFDFTNVEIDMYNKNNEDYIKKFCEEHWSIYETNDNYICEKYWFYEKQKELLN